MRRLLREIDSRELTEWMVFERLYGPIGQRRDDYLISLLAAVIHNTQVEKKSQAKSPDKFLPDWSAPTP